MLTSILHNTRHRLRRTKWVHRLVDAAGLLKLGKWVYYRRSLAQGRLTANLMGYRLNFSVQSIREIERIDSLYQEEAFLKLILDATRECKLVFDVGANIGVISLLMAVANSDLIVHAFEPEPRNAEELRRNVRLNQFEDRVHVHELALSDQGGTACFHVSDEIGAGTHTLVAKRSRGSGVIEVQLQTMDDFCQQHGILPDVVKIDVEGAEDGVLRGMKHVIAQGKPVNLFIEVHNTAGFDRQAESLFGNDYSIQWERGRRNERHRWYARIVGKAGG